MNLLPIIEHTIFFILKLNTRMKEPDFCSSPSFILQPAKFQVFFFHLAPRVEKEDLRMQMEYFLHP